MKVETKFNNGDEIFFIENKKVCSSIIRYAKIEVHPEGTRITYMCNTNIDERVHIKVEEIYAHKTKDALLKSL